MPRRKPQRKNSRRSEPPKNSEGSLFGGALMRQEPGPAGARDQSYMVRSIPGARATKSYRCPGCDHEIRPGVAHLVAWPAEYGNGEDRRHWHTGCWSGRGTRGLTRRWS
ncbi:ATP/GTP-binding protein [Rhodococcus sp. WMMA185]|uniref:ATP/GTP-binding protein n=1 Tax=Rhodococcus sp. WMMA185 TaxID=679318 RepID=UPI0009FC52E0|nr:ATP/GTP-binding protein [Rhodococcus sp. WMMA185]